MGHSEDTVRVQLGYSEGTVGYSEDTVLFLLFDLILYVHSTIFQLCGTVFLG